SNTLISMFKRFIPDKVRIPAYIVIIATFVSIVDLVLQAYIPKLAASLGLFIPLIVVNCIVLGRAEAFAGKNSVLDSLLDGLGMGLGFTLALFIMGFCRELLGSVSVFGNPIIEDVDGILVFVLAPGAFIVLGIVMAIVRKFQNKGAPKN
ncbi:electron transport complex subunit RsxE, partial [Bacteroidales bacterium OttesenSCG-928-B11]|nr:electron transport complex subunit RsxE [Bacteroidales bacterium OttesenSCG-928-B11]